MAPEEIHMICLERAMAMPGVSSTEDAVAAARKLEGYVLGTAKLDPLAEIRAKAEEVATGYRRDPEPFTEAEVARMICSMNTGT